MARSHRIAAAVAALLVSFSPGLTLADQANAPGEDQNTAVIDVAFPSLASPVAPTAVTGVPAVRRLDADDEMTGSEPDPETFDRRGLELWWRQRSQPDAADTER